ncbi:MmgE/PrpD family protein [Lutimaribacter sp. EGI FJ00015]|uniref:MmgE/PrpD family protein n=1 Tax=Lutimaribacter degradans TaxID=2945989 RepID=A0ACC5ZSN3_9RHOB|nr:MmgE/PrpD family protein [Lutimaribacter sp. EGI FJ00013]MCM2561193.1 MmgE/PrpD family protein [Lutimaribacter sp. EGI FJ00013]MCO0611858.1 MmgE/PrpD family protein [Lutimaribacter sp. EGI FJ00015]MCO0635021.1 MmgE/PrpD family protein [Lutimaribacter sp. EGI FJ00014]
MNITQQLADFACNSKSEEVTPDAVLMTRLSLLDWVAVGLAGRDEPVARITRDMVLEEAGTAQASLFGSQTRVPARAAALANGATSHALDYDDTHFAHIGHPSVAVFPAALAMAQARGASGAEFLHAALVGIEASIRVGIWLGRAHYQTGFHQTATAGAFGAGLAAARLMGLGAGDMAMVLGLLATRASGLKSQFSTMGKPFNAGLAAANGVEAAQLVAKGFVANPDALEAAQGFGPTHAGENITNAMEGIGKTWFFETISHKFHACCHGLHAALEAQSTLLPIAHDAVRAIKVTTHPRWMTVCNQTAPDTGLGAKFSYSTVLAMQILGHDTARLDSYSDAICADAKVQALRTKVSVAADDSLRETEAHVSIKTDTDVQTAAFDLDAPMPIATRQEKLQTKAASLLGTAQAATIWKTIKADADPRTMGEIIAGG